MTTVDVQKEQANPAVDAHRASPTWRRPPTSSPVSVGAGGDVVAEQLGALVRTFDRHGDLDELLTELLFAATTVIPGVDEASVSVVVDRYRLECRTSTGELAGRLDALQQQIGEGPCLDACFEQLSVRIDDTATDRRWPQFSAQARRAGVAGILTLRLHLDGDRLTVLNLYSRHPDVLTDESKRLGRLFAGHAAVAYVGLRTEAQLMVALAHRDVIGQAKGILVERYKISADRAFQVLTRVSQNTNRKLYELATELVETGALPQ